MKSVLRIWKDFTKKEQYECAANEYRCLQWGLYVFGGSRYQCGCEREDVDWKVIE